DADDDSDIPFTATDAAADTLALQQNAKLIVWDNKTFAPGGNVTIHGNAQANTYDGSLEIRSGATFTSTGSQTHTLAGNFTVDSGGTFVPSTSLLIFNATTSGKTISPSSSSFYHLT